MRISLSTLLFAILVGSGMAYAQKIQLTEEKSTYPFSDYAALLNIDDQDSLSWEEVYHLPPNQFTAYIQFREDRPTQWIRFKLNNTTPQPLVYYQFLYHNVDYADSYLIDSTGTLAEKQMSGTLVKIDDRPFREFLWNHCIIPIQIPPGRFTLLTRIHNTRNYTLQHIKISKLSLIEQSLFYDYFGGSAYLSGLFFGYFMAIIFLSVVLYFSEKEKIYFQTSLLILFGSAYPFVIDGHFFNLLFPDYPQLSLWVENLLPMAALTLTNWLAADYLNIRSIAPKALIPHYVLVALTFVFVPAMLYVQVYSLWIGIATVSVLYTMALGVLAVRHRIVHAYYFSIGYAQFLLLLIFGLLAPYFEILNYQYVIKFFNVQALANFYFSCLLLAVIHRFRRSRKDEFELQLANERAIHEAEVERRQLIEQQNQELEQKVEARTLEIEQKNKELEKLDLMKSRFFSNISHEFRTPLTLIIGPAKNQLQKVKNDPKSKRDLETILTSADQLLGLINQLLDLAKAENDGIDLNLEKVSCRQFIVSQLDLFFTLAESKKIHLLFNDVIDFDLRMDVGKMQKVLANVVYNALKFSPEQSTITIKTYETEGNAYIEILDQGPGIPDEFQEKVFDRFYQLNSSDTTQGSGIGLALAKVYVTLHGGSIHVEKNIPIGSKFVIELPTQMDLTADPNRPLSAGLLQAQPNYTAMSEDHLSLEMGGNSQNPKILLIEDDPSLRRYIQSCFDEEYEVWEANNGRDGLEMARTQIPDVIVSDVMMPKMDGVTMTDLLKKDMLTSHIPVLLLTAKASVESKVEGLSSGADDYLTKPFDSNELIARVKTLIRNRKILYQKYGQAIQQPSDQNILPDIEQKFLDLVTCEIEKHMSNDEFDVEKLSEKLIINRTTLYRKLKAISGQTPTTFIKTTRLHRAKLLLEESQMNVSEIAHAVGFSSVAYFSSSFKEAFGISPSEYVV